MVEDWMTLADLAEQVSKLLEQTKRDAEEIALLREALKPFAAIQTDPGTISGPTRVWGYIENSMRLHEACEAARAALAARPAEGKGE